MDFVPILKPDRSLPSENDRPRLLTEDEIQKICDHVPFHPNSSIIIASHARQQMINWLRKELRKIKIAPSKVNDFIKRMISNHIRALINPGTPNGFAMTGCVTAPLMQMALDAFKKSGEKTNSNGITRLQSIIFATKSENNEMRIGLRRFNGRRLTYKEAYMLRGAFVAITPRLLMKDYKIIPRHTIKDWWSIAQLNIYGNTLPESRFVLRLFIDVDKLYIYQITLQQIAEALQRGDDCVVKCVVSPTVLGIIDIYPDINQTKKLQQRQFINDYSELIFFSRCILKSFDDLRIRGCSGIKAVTPLITPITRVFEEQVITDINTIQIIKNNQLLGYQVFDIWRTQLDVKFMYFSGIDMLDVKNLLTAAGFEYQEMEGSPSRETILNSPTIIEADEYIDIAVSREVYYLSPVAYLKWLYQTRQEKAPADIQNMEQLAKLIEILERVEKSLGLINSDTERFSYGAPSLDRSQLEFLQKLLSVKRKTPGSEEENPRWTSQIVEIGNNKERTLVIDHWTPITGVTGMIKSVDDANTKKFSEFIKREFYMGHSLHDGKVYQKWGLVSHNNSFRSLDENYIRKILTLSKLQYLERSENTQTQETVIIVLKQEKQKLASPSSIIGEQLEKDAKQGINIQKRRIFKSRLQTANEFITLNATGSNMTDILNHPLVDHRYTYSDNMYQIRDRFGIEATRTFIFMELITLFGESIDPRQLALATDNICNKGPFGLTFIGSVRQGNGFFSSAYFEKAVESIVKAAVTGSEEGLNNVFAANATGALMNIGTGMNQIFHKSDSTRDYRVRSNEDEERLYDEDKANIPEYNFISTNQIGMFSNITQETIKNRRLVVIPTDEKEIKETIQLFKIETFIPGAGRQKIAVRKLPPTRIQFMDHFSEKITSILREVVIPQYFHEALLKYQPGPQPVSREIDIVVYNDYLREYLLVQDIVQSTKYYQNVEDVGAVGKNVSDDEYEAYIRANPIPEVFPVNLLGNEFYHGADFLALFT